VAVVFLLSTFGVTGAIVWQIWQDSKNDTADTADVGDIANQNTNENALKGKQMDDFTPIAKIDELQTVDLQVGTGEEVKAGDTLTVDYTGAVAATGKIFESSLDSGQQATFKLDEVIPGWQEGMLGMKAGGKRRLLIPADKAYGANPPSADIPANADLVFDVTLHKIGE